jgi:hypothetical protein
MATVASERYVNKGEVNGQIADTVRGGKWETKRSLIPGRWIVRHNLLAQGSSTDFEPPLQYVATTRVFAVGKEAARRRGEAKLSQPPRKRAAKSI